MEAGFEFEPDIASAELPKADMKKMREDVAVQQVAKKWLAQSIGCGELLKLERARVG